MYKIERRGAGGRRLKIVLWDGPNIFPPPSLFNTEFPQKCADAAKNLLCRVYYHCLTFTQT